jgi:subtilisin family serine protease
MRRLLPLGLLLLPTLVLALALPPGRQPQPVDGAVLIDGMPVAADQILIRLRGEVLAGRAQRPAELAELPGLAADLASLGAVSSRVLIADEGIDELARAEGLHRDYIVHLGAGESVSQRLADWAARPEVELAEPDWIARALLIPADTYFSQQWALRNTGQSPGNGTPNIDIDAELAWDLTTGSTDVVIAILDTGVDLNHPDLQAKIVPGYNFVGNNSNADDDNMHGTACASLAAAVTNNSQGISGVDWLARIMPIKVLNSAGNGNTSDITAGVNWARTNGADVISMSLGGGGFNSSFNSAINAAFNAGVVVVSATGNDNDNSISYPAAYTNSMAIGALSPCNERKSPSSCDGEWWWGSNYGTGLDVLAPGVKLRSATINGYINDMNGTSGATPHAAGVAALIRARNPSLTAAQIRDIIRDSAIDMGAAGWDSQTGYGRLNAHQALLLTPSADPCDNDFSGPQILHTPVGNVYDNTAPVIIAASISDDCDVAGATLRWQVNGGSWSEAAMQHGGGDSYSGAVPAQAYGSTVLYQIVAVDASSNDNQSQVQHSYQVLDPCTVDQTPPQIDIVLPIADTGDTTGPYFGIVLIQDPCGLSLLQVGFTVDGGPVQAGQIYQISGPQYAVQIPGQPQGGLVVWTVLAFDGSPFQNMAQQSWQFTVTAPDPCEIDAEGPELAHTPLDDTLDDSLPRPVEATASDPCGVAGLTLRWQVDGGAWSAEAMTNTMGQTWAGALPAQAHGSAVVYEIIAVDGSANANISQVQHAYQVIDPCSLDETPPLIELQLPIADTSDIVGPYLGLVLVQDACGLSLVEVEFRVDGGALQPGTITPAGGSLYSVQLPGQPAGGFVEWTVTAIDGSPAANESSQSWSFTVTPPDPCESDSDGPMMELTTPIGDSSDTAGPYLGEVSVEDPCGVDEVTASYTVDGGAPQAATVTALGDSGYAVEIPGLAEGGLVEWTVTAIDGSPAANESSQSWSFTVTPPPAPTELAIAWVGPGEVQLSWLPAEHATMYRVEWAPELGGEWIPVTVTEALEWTLAVAEGEQRIFRVIALN